MGNEVRIKAGVYGNAKQEVKSIHDAWNKFQRDGSQGVKAGLTAAAATKGFSLLDQAISGAIGLLGDANQAALDEEASISRLDSALRANVKGWNGNGEAIEKVLKSRMKLGFSDDEQRESLALLVVATKDHSKALNIERTAMDLARLKRIDLKTASEALIKVEAGQFRALKALGIELRDGATQTEALAAVQAAAAGQAEDYAKTNSGKLLKSQVEVGEAMEKLGGVIMPAVADGLGAIATGVSEVGLAFDKLAGRTGMSFTEVELAAKNGSQAAGAHLNWLKAQAGAVGPVIHNMATASKDDLAEIGDAAGDAAGDVENALETIVESFDRARSDLESAASGAADSLFDPILAKAELAEIELEEGRLRNVRNAAKAGSKERAQAQSDLDAVNKKRMEVLATLASYGDKSAATTLKAMIATAKASGTLSDEQIADLNLLLSKLNQVEAAARRLASLKFMASASKDDGFRAGGGPVFPGAAYTVGERGPETLVMGPSGGGYVIPNAGGGMSAPVVQNFYATFAGLAPASPADKERVRQWLRELGFVERR
jgi:hypothetical protein